MAEQNDQSESDAGTPMPSEPHRNSTPAFGVAAPFTPGNEPSLPPEYESKDQLARRLGVSRRTIDQLVAERRLPFVRLGRKILRFYKRDVDEHLARKNRVAPLP